jgi:hypothetical protein
LLPRQTAYLGIGYCAVDDVEIIEVASLLEWEVYLLLLLRVE